jgi:hypothetical protein
MPYPRYAVAGQAYCSITFRCGSGRLLYDQYGKGRREGDLGALVVILDLDCANTVVL